MSEDKKSDQGANQRQQACKRNRGNHHIKSVQSVSVCLQKNPLTFANIKTSECLESNSFAQTKTAAGFMGTVTQRRHVDCKVAARGTGSRRHHDPRGLKKGNWRCGLNASAREPHFFAHSLSSSQWCAGDLILAPKS
jgi:hypothetical protein